jgi:hypothetical protein
MPMTMTIVMQMTRAALPGSMFSSINHPLKTNWWITLAR